MKLITQVLFAITLSSICANSTGAEQEKKEKKTAAIKRFNAAVSFFNAGEHQKAVDAFRKANQIYPSWKIQYNIGQCEAALKRYGLAIEAFEHYLGEGGDDIPEERRDEVLNELDRLRRMVGSVRVKGEDGVGVFIDGIERGRTPIQSPILVTAGVEHWFWLVNGDGSKLLSVKDTVSGGQTIDLTTPGYNLPKTTVKTKPDPVVPAPPQAESQLPAVNGPQTRSSSNAGDIQAAGAAQTNTETAAQTTAETTTQVNAETTAQENAETTAQENAETAAETTTKAAPDKQQPRMEPATAEHSPFEESQPQTEIPAEKTGISPALFWIGASSTVAFGAVALTMGLIVDSKWEKAEKNPTNEAVRNNGSTLQTVGYVALALTGAALIATVVAVPFTRWKKGEGLQSEVSVSLLPWAVAHSGGIAIDGRFSL